MSTLCLHECLYVRELFIGFKGYGAQPTKIQMIPTDVSSFIPSSERIREGLRL